MCGSQIVKLLKYHVKIKKLKKEEYFLSYESGLLQ